MEKSFTQFSFPLKYLITSAEWDPNVLQNPNRGPNKIERTIGLLWDIVGDTILALLKYNLYGTSRGREITGA